MNRSIGARIDIFRYPPLNNVLVATGLTIVYSLPISTMIYVWPADRIQFTNLALHFKRLPAPALEDSLQDVFYMAYEESLRHFKVDKLSSEGVNLLSHKLVFCPV